MSNEPKLWDKRIEFIAGLLQIAAHENEDKITISTSAIADLIHDRALFKQQAEERGKALKDIAESYDPWYVDSVSMRDYARQALGKEQTE